MAGSNAMSALALALLVGAAMAGAQSTSEMAPAEAAPLVRPPVRAEQIVENCDLARQEEARLQYDKGADEQLARRVAEQGYWLDPQTGLMWAARDNGKAVSWRQAEKNCRNVRTGGFADWRLATREELATLVDWREFVSVRGCRVEYYYAVHGGGWQNVRGRLQLSGNPWSMDRPLNRFGRPYGMGWFFNFMTAEPSYDLQLWRNVKQALCVRRP